MRSYSKLERFPLGSILAGGFLKRQMQLGKDGICGHLHELEPKMINAPFLKKEYVEAWGDGDQSGWGAEISGNYWSGYIQFAFTLNDEEMIKVATDWVDSMLKNQKSDGYLGTYYEEDAKIFEDYNAWGTACAMRGLLAFYEATERRDVLDAVYRCMLWFCEKWSGDNKTCYAGQFIIEPMIFTYRLTGDERLVRFAEEYLEYLCEHDIFSQSHKAMLEEDYVYNAGHTAGVGAMVRLPALVYSVTGKQEYLDATVRRLDLLAKKAIHVTGAPVSITEYIGPVGSTAESEYCNFAFYNATYSYMSHITGEGKYGDKMEIMFYNAAQGARKKDERAIAYLSAPNQIYATDTSSTGFRDMQVYAPCYPVSCCPVNAVAVVPEFVRGMLLHDASENIYVTAYGPCSLRYRDIALTVHTAYPFRNRAKIEISCDKTFDLNLRIPEWCKSYRIEKSFGDCDCEVGENGYVTVRHAWRKGDWVEMIFDAEVEVIRVDDHDCASKFPIAVKYGALVFSYHIPEEWIAFPGRPMTPLPDGWSWFKVKPVFEEPKVKDYHEMLGLRKYTIPWNVALDENLSPADFEVELIEQNGYEWEHPMIRLHTHCYKAPALCAPYPCRTFEPFGDRQPVTDRLPLVLEPYGCTNLRITYFPRADLSKRENRG